MSRTLPSKHLNGALRFAANSGGTCFYRAAGLVLDWPGAVLCIGTFAGATGQEKLIANAAPKDFIHAWVEKDGAAYAPTLLSGSNRNMGPLPLDEYLEVNGARDIHRMSRSDLLKLSGEYGLSSHLRNGTPVKKSKTLPLVLLESLAVDYRLEDGQVVAP